MITMLDKRACGKPDQRPVPLHRSNRPERCRSRITPVDERGERVTKDREGQ
jgi:hypothetical protein